MLWLTLARVQKWHKTQKKLQIAHFNFDQAPGVKTGLHFEKHSSYCSTCFSLPYAALKHSIKVMRGGARNVGTSGVGGVLQMELSCLRAGCCVWRGHCWQLLSWTQQVITRKKWIMVERLSVSVWDSRRTGKIFQRHSLGNYGEHKMSHSELSWLI